MKVENQMRKPMNKQLLRKLIQSEILQEKLILVWEAKTEHGQSTPFALINLIKEMKKNSPQLNLMLELQDPERTYNHFDKLETIFSDESSIYYKYRWLLMLMYERGLKGTAAQLRTKDANICRFIKKVVQYRSNWRE